MESITKREAVKLFGLGSAYLLSGGCTYKNLRKKHIITLSFDDGLEKSSIKTAEIYEKYKLSATINVLAKGFLNKDPMTPPLGDFDLWNNLQARGHEIMPHGYHHRHLPDLPFDEACALINKCLDTFSERLDGVAWGPMSSAFLDELLNRLTGMDSVDVLSVTQALDLA